MNPVTKFVVGSTFPIHPPRGGGQVRIFHLCRELARHRPVDVVTLVEADQPSCALELAPGLTEIRVPKSRAFAAAEGELYSRARIPITDIAFAEMHELMPAFSHAVAGSLTDGAVIMPSCPYAFPAMAAATRGHGCWFDAQNVEVDLKASMLPRRRSIGRRLVRRIREVERDCCQDAEVILTVTAEDGKRLRELYGLPAERFRTVPNGVDAAAIRFQPPAERRALRERLRLHRPLALFIGSWHEPNLRAARRILRLAAGMPDVRFGIAGSVGMPLAGVELPSNVELFGVVSDELKQALLAVASVALNPMLEGSGTNIKMLDYLAAGVPVVSTEVGVRGLELDDEAGVRIVPIRAFAAAIRAVIDEPQEMAEARAREGRRQIEERFDWPVIARGIVAGARIPDVAQPAASSVATTA